MIDLGSLNKNQLRAVKWGEGPLLVLAGPGSGKTKVLTLRIARLIEESPEENFKVLGLTLTNQAAAEMQKRVAAMVPYAERRILLATFHSFAARLLSQHGSHIGLRSDFTVLSHDTDRISLLEEAIDQANVNGHAWDVERLVPLITWLTESNIPPEKAPAALNAGSYQEPESLAAVYRKYRELMIEQNCLDFPGLIAEALGLLRNNKGVRKFVPIVYPYICVDEFQEINRSQYEILSHIVKPTTHNLFVVADDDQVIYQWNGANIRRIEALRQDFNAESLQLPENYRCPADVVDIANTLISCNHNLVAEKMETGAYKADNKSQVVRLHPQFGDFSEEADWVAKDIAGRPREQRANCVVLARTRKLLQTVVESLKRHDVQGYVAAKKNEFEGAPMQWLHSVLRLANSRNNNQHLRRVCKSFFALEGINLNVNDIIPHASVEDGDCLRSWIAAAMNSTGLSEHTKEFLQKPALPALADHMDFWAFQDGAFQWLDSLPKVSPDKEDVFNEYQKEKETWEQLVDEISNQHGGQDVTLHLLLRELDLRSKSPEPPQDAVPCFTIHAAKGMEFDHVYLVGMVEDQLPSWAAKKKGDRSLEMQEERRNCFVAITRAKESLSLTYSSKVHGRQKEPSRFLHEMGLLQHE